jgi:hypothetical protein
MALCEGASEKAKYKYIEERVVALQGSVLNTNTPMDARQVEVPMASYSFLQGKSGWIVTLIPSFLSAYISLVVQNSGFPSVTPGNIGGMVGGVIASAGIGLVIGFLIILFRGDAKPTEVSASYTIKKSIFFSGMIFTIFIIIGGYG